MALAYWKKLTAFVTAKKISVSMVFLILVFALCLWGLYSVVDFVFEDGNTSFDEIVFAWIRPHINSTNTRIFNAITFFGSTTFLVPGNLLLIIYFLFFKKDKHNAWKVAAITITNVLVLLLLKNILQRERPSQSLIAKAHDYSFPSGHTFSSVVFFGMLIYIIHQNSKHTIIKSCLIIFLAGLVMAVGFSRIYLRMHYASDVIAGFCLGVIWLLLAKWILVKTDAIKK